MSAGIWGVEVNEIVVLTYSGSDAERWIPWRARFEAIGRVICLRVGFPGDEVFVACESREDARELIASWHEIGMVHKSAAKVRQLKPADVSVETWATVTACMERFRAGEAAR